MTLFVTVSWLLWTCLFFSLARAVQESAMEHGVVPATWGDIKGEFIYIPCDTAVFSCRDVHGADHEPWVVSSEFEM